MKNKYFAIALIALWFSTGAGAMTYKESVELALKNNPAVITSQKKLDAAKARFGQAMGAFLPTVKLDANYGQSYTQPSTVQFTTQTATGASTTSMTFGTDEKATVKSWTFSASQPLFVAALFPGFSLAQRGVDAAQEDFRKSVLETKFNVTAAFYGVLATEKFFKLSEDSLNMAQSHLNQVDVMLKSGVATRADQLRAKVQVANSEVALTQARNSLELAKSSLNNVLGRNADKELEITEEKTGEIPSLPEYRALINSAFENSPNWKGFVLNRRMAEDNLSLNRTSLFPAFMLTGQNGFRGTEYSSYKSESTSWTVAGVASWTLFDGLGMQNRINEAAANLEATKATEEQVRNGVILEVRRAYLDLKSAVETIGSAKKAVDFAEESHKVSGLRFNSGVGTNLEEIDAQVALTQARTNYLKALFDLEIAKAELNKVIGKEAI